MSMHRCLFLMLMMLLAGSMAHAQQPLNTKEMNYVIMSKPNNIIYHDTLYRGVKEFSYLFYRAGNPELIQYLERHQSNKIAGQVLGIAGTVASIIGISRFSSADQKGLGWALLGGGFAATFTGGYLLLQGQRNLQMAVSLFNQKNNRAALGVGTASHTAGLVYQF